MTEGDPQTIETDCVFVFSDRQGAHALQVGPPGDSELMMCSPEDAETVRTLVKSLDLAQITYQRYSDGQAKVLSVEIVPRQ